MTALEAAAFLEIPYKSFERIFWRHSRPDVVRKDQWPSWVPTPVKGSVYSQKAVYLREDIEKLKAILDDPESRMYRGKAVRN